MSAVQAERRGMHARRWMIVAAASVVEAAALPLRGYPITGGRVVVRCSKGHLFTTLWIPGASLKSLRLGLWRIQWCPAGRHWSVVTPVRGSDLSARQMRAARRHHDMPIP